MYGSSPPPRGLYRNTDVFFEIPTIENPTIDISHDISSGGSICTPSYPPPPLQAPRRGGGCQMGCL